MLKNPGRKPNSVTTSNTAAARACEPTAKSTIVLRPRAEALERSLLSTVTTMSPALPGVLRGGPVTTTHATQPCLTALANSHDQVRPPSACASVNAITADGGLL